MKKGKLLKKNMDRWGVYARLLETYEKNGDLEGIKEIESLRAEEQKEYDAYMETLPQRFSKDYSQNDYEKDCENVRNYYTKWERENIYWAKESLKRCRRFEKREGLEAFDVLEEKIKKTEQLKRLEQREEIYARAS